MITSVISKLRNIFSRKQKNLSVRFPEHHFGRGTYGNDLRVHSWDEGATLKVGAFCSIGRGVQIFLGGEHRVDWLTTYPFNILWQEGAHITGHPATKGDIIIGNDVWIGREAIILSGVKIGDGAVVGARAVVSKDVAPYSIVVGNPARSIKNRFSEDAVRELMKIKWWEWQDDKIGLFLPKLLCGDVLGFINAAKSNQVK